MKRLWMLLVVLSPLAVSMAQIPSSLRPWRYELIEGSTFTDDCPICGRPTILYPLRGTFELLLDNANTLSTTYRLTNLQFYAGDREAPSYLVSGNGTFRIGGEVAVRQNMLLDSTVCNSVPACRDVTFTNDDGALRVAFPLVDISLTQTQQNLFSVYKIRLVAAPVQEIWFTVANGFTPTNGGPVVRPGDVVSHSGRTIRTNVRLLQQVGVTNPSSTLRIDAFDVAPGGEIYFSLSEDAVSATLGQLHHGDLLSNRGRVVRRNQQLMAAFGIQPPVPDVGLDAVHVKPDGEILFSIHTNVFAEGKGVMLAGGDVLSSTGQIVKRNAELRAKFHTNIPGADLGLDALYFWPNGEIWFSLESGFPDSELGMISDGDLLSSEGVIVFKSGELLSRLHAPSGMNFGLGDIFIVSDAVAAPVSPRFLPPRLEQNLLRLDWAGTNRVFLLEQAERVTGPWQTLSPIDPDTSFSSPATNQESFYRLRGW